MNAIHGTSSITVGMPASVPPPETPAPSAMK
jgi:hypothetical protein